MIRGGTTQWNLNQRTSFDRAASTAWSRAKQNTHYHGKNLKKPWEGEHAHYVPIVIHFLISLIYDRRFKKIKPEELNSTFRSKEDLYKCLS